MTMRLAGKSALITGAAHGIGDIAMNRTEATTARLPIACAGRLDGSERADYTLAQTCKVDGRQWMS